MSWKKWLTYNPYKKLWSLIGKRPWTFIIRDAWHKAEFVWIIGLVSLGVWLGHNYDWEAILIGWLLFSLGYLGGHLFWGKPYIEGQEGK